MPTIFYLLILCCILCTYSCYQSHLICMHNFNALYSIRWFLVNLKVLSRLHFKHALQFKGISKQKYRKDIHYHKNVLYRIATQLWSTHVWQVPLGSLGWSYLACRILCFPLEVYGHSVAKLHMEQADLSSSCADTYNQNIATECFHIYGCVVTVMGSFISLSNTVSRTCRYIFNQSKTSPHT